MTKFREYETEKYEIWFVACMQRSDNEKVPFHKIYESWVRWCDGSDEQVDSMKRLTYFLKTKHLPRIGHYVYYCKLP